MQFLMIAVYATLACSCGPEASPGTSLPTTVEHQPLRVLRDTADVLPPAALTNDTGHPLQGTIRSFLANQGAHRDFKSTGLTGQEYLRIISGQVAVFRRCQDSVGAIIDPVEKIEWQYSTPCYALAVALLTATGYDSDPGLLASGIKAMSVSVDEMHEYRTAHNHGEFFIQPVMLALDLYRKTATPEQMAEWERKLKTIDPYRLYPDNLRAKARQGKAIYNHNIVALAGEYLRCKPNRGGDLDFVETHLQEQAKNLSPLGMYRDPNVPMVYDEFSRQFLASMLVEGYHGPSYEFYRDRIWRGAWTSLFMQSPFGECPTGGRSAQHIWNEAQSAVTYEVYATQYARKGRLGIAGAFKRAAHLSLGCIGRWLRPDGSGYVVKNRYPIEAHHGYERYSAQSQYNLLACWLMTVAYLYRDEGIPERPCPADVGGFVVPMVDDFHKVFANAGGTYIEYETKGDLHYNPTGLIRCHIKGANPQLGPSDGAVHQFDTKTKADLGGENLCVGPGWQDAQRAWHRLADYAPSTPPNVEVLEQNPDRVRFRVTYEGPFDGASRITQTVIVEPAGITIHDRLEGEQLKNVRVCYPMLVFDGFENTRVELSGNAVTMALRDGAIRFVLLEPAGIGLKRAGTLLEHRNGQVEAVYADVPTLEACYRIEAR